MGISIRNGRVVDPASGLDAETDLHIENGQIAAIGAPPPGFQAERELNASGQVVCPGLVDLRVRLREPGQEHKGTILSETRAAAASGITTLCCPPDTDPVLDNPAVAKLIRQRASDAGYARVLPVGALTAGLDGEHLAEMLALQRVGCVAVSNAARPITNTLVMRRAMEYAATLGITVQVQPEDPWLAASGCMHEGAVSARLGLPGIPEGAEVIAVGRELMLVEQTGARLHFCQLTSARAVAMVAEARRQGLPVSADVSAHHLYLTEMDVNGFNSACHVRPPLRTQRDRDTLRRALADGVISAVVSDHQPHDADAKLAPFAATESGVSALETLLPLVLRLVDDRVMSLSQAIARLTCDPAQILGIEAGTLAAGAIADVCVFDPEHYWTVSEARLLSAGKNTPFLGWEVKGRVTHTLLAGRIVHEAQLP